MSTKPTIEMLLHRARIGKFISVGAVGATIETVLVAILTTSTTIGPLIAKVIGAETSISTMFVINDHWTFADNGKKGLFAGVRRWIRSHLVRVLGLSIAFLVLYILTEFNNISLMIYDLDFWPTIANIIGIGVAMTINYIAESVFTWNIGYE